MFRLWHALPAAALLVGCAGRFTQGDATSHVALSGSSPLSVGATPAAEALPRAVAPTAAASAPLADAPAHAAPRPCGALDCMAFVSAQAAFDYVLRSEPRVLAIGEAHAQ